MSITWDLRIDYHRHDADGLTHASVKDVETGIELVPGSFIVVGNEGADPALAEVVQVDADDVVLVQVLPGRAEDHLQLLGGPAMLTPRQDGPR